MHRPSSLQYAERECDCDGPYSVYVIREVGGRGRTYVGKTNDLARRIRQHNGELAGGARATRGGAWEYALVVRGFECDRHALQAEWRLKRERRATARARARARDGDGGGGAARALAAICSKSFSVGEGWTSNSPSPDEQWLCVRTDLLRTPPDGWPDYWGWEPLSAGADESSYVVPSSHTEPAAAGD